MYSPIVLIRRVWRLISGLIARRFVKKSESSGSDDPYNYPLF
jgi:hypothetical protein